MEGDSFHFWYGRFTLIIKYLPIYWNMTLRAFQSQGTSLAVVLPYRNVLYTGLFLFLPYILHVMSVGCEPLCSVVTFMCVVVENVLQGFPCHIPFSVKQNKEGYWIANFLKIYLYIMVSELKSVKTNCYFVRLGGFRWLLMWN